MLSLTVDTSTPSPSYRWPDAVLAGVASAMRTFAGPAALAARGRFPRRPTAVIGLLSVAELATDKTSVATDRTDAPAIGGRLVAGAYTGRELAGRVGIAAGAIGAAVGTYATIRTRDLVVTTTGLPDPVIAVGEDVIAYGLAAVATREVPEPAEEDPEPPPRRLGVDIVKGLVAGLVGTAAMTLAQGAEFTVTDAEPSTSPADVADLIKRRAGFGRLRHRRAANQGMHWLYGTSWGIPYGVVAASSKTPPEISGPVFGLLVWGAALAHQPVLGIAEVPWKRSPASLGSEALFHLVYGVGAGAALRSMQRVR